MCTWLCLLHEPLQFISSYRIGSGRPSMASLCVISEQWDLLLHLTALWKHGRFKQPASHGRITLTAEGYWSSPASLPPDEERGALQRNAFSESFITTCNINVLHVNTHKPLFVHLHAHIAVILKKKNIGLGQHIFKSCSKHFRTTMHKIVLQPDRCHLNRSPEKNETNGSVTALGSITGKKNMDFAYFCIILYVVFTLKNAGVLHYKLPNWYFKTNIKSKLKPCLLC